MPGCDFPRVCAGSVDPPSGFGSGCFDARKAAEQWAMSGQRTSRDPRPGCLSKRDFPGCTLQSVTLVGQCGTSRPTVGSLALLPVGFANCAQVRDAVNRRPFGHVLSPVQSSAGMVSRRHDSRSWGFTVAAEVIRVAAACDVSAPAVLNSIRSRRFDRAARGVGRLGRSVQDGLGAVCRATLGAIPIAVCTQSNGKGVGPCVWRRHASGNRGAV